MKLIYCILIFAGFTVHAQEFKLGKVTRKELEEKSHPSDTSAAAAILFKRGKTYFTLNQSWNIITEVECRIKIYKKEGYEQATREFTYYTGGKSIDVNFSDACTYNLVNGDIEVTKLKSDGEFKEEVRDDYMRKKITLPNVREGSIIEFSYKVITPYLTTIRDWYFEYDIPANHVEYEVAIPVFFGYNRYTTGYLDLKATEPVYRYGIGGGFKESVVTFLAENVKAYKEEPYVNSIENYLSIIKYELASSQFNDGVKNYSTDWPALAKRIYGYEEFGGELSLNSYFKDDLALIVDQSAPTAEKIDKVYNYVKNRMAWDGGEQYYCKKGVKKAYEDKTGNSAEINLMLTAMLREVGVEANPVLISTRRNGVALYPSRTAYDYVVAGIETPEGVTLLDATSKYTLPNILPIRALNWKGRMIRKNGSSIEVDLMPVKNSKEVINITSSVNANGVVTGKVRSQSMDYDAYTYREKYGDVNTNVIIEKLEGKYNGIQISGYTVDGAKDLTKPVVEDFDFEHAGLCDVIGDKIYFNPMLFFSERESPFKSEERKYPVDFVYPYQDRYLININLPEGYKVESMPESAFLAMEDNIGTFRFNIAEKEGAIQLAVFFDINYPIISQDYYKALRDFFHKVIEKQNEKIVLKKA